MYQMTVSYYCKGFCILHNLTLEDSRKTEMDCAGCGAGGNHLLLTWCMHYTIDHCYSMYLIFNLYGSDESIKLK